MEARKLASSVISTARDPPGHPLLILPEDLGGSQAGAEAAQQDAVQARPGLGEAVVDPEPLLAPHDQAVLAKVGQMSGDSRLGQFEGFMKMTDAHLFLFSAQQVEQAEPDRVRKCLEHAGRFVEAGTWCHRTLHLSVRI